MKNSIPKISLWRRDESNIAKSINISSHKALFIISLTIDNEERDFTFHDRLEYLMLIAVGCD